MYDVAEAIDCMKFHSAARSGVLPIIFFKKLKTLYASLSLNL